MLSEAKHLTVNTGLITTLVPYKAEIPCVAFSGNTTLEVNVNPAVISPSNYWQNIGTVFHEVTHNITGLTDPDLQRALGLSTKALSDNITQKLLQDCF